MEVIKQICVEQELKKREPEKNFNICRILSKEVYDPIIRPIIEDDLGNSWELLESQVVCKPYTKNNFTCAAYKNGSEIIISFRGTDEIRDVIADLSFLKKCIPIKTVKYATKYYNEIRSKNPKTKIYLTGHSLGGGYAQILSYQQNKEEKECSAITFNAPGTGYLIKKEEIEYKEKLKEIVNNYVIMNDFVGNFGEHIGNTYYFQPYPLDRCQLNKKEELETAHGSILRHYEYQEFEQEFGPRYSKPKNFGLREAWALWVYDINNKNPKEALIKRTLDIKIKTEDLDKAIAIMNCSDIKLLNTFYYKTDKDVEGLLSYNDRKKKEETTQANKEYQKERIQV